MSFRTNVRNFNLLNLLSIKISRGVYAERSVVLEMIKRELRHSLWREGKRVKSQISGVLEKVASDGSLQAGKYLWRIYETLDRHFGNLHWWPGETPFEIAVGAILTQNTNWKNVEIAIRGLKSRGLLVPDKLLETEDNVVAELIRSSGYYNIKTKRLKAFLHFLDIEYEGKMDKMFEEDLWVLRGKLLGVKGIGEETADSILLYAGNRPIFVVDSYTRRILERAEIINRGWSYRNIQELFMIHLPHNAELYNQYHALLVNTGKHFCRKNPLCEQCPLGEVRNSKLGKI